MAQSPVTPSPFDRVIEAASAVGSNKGLLAVGMIILLVALFPALVFPTGYDRLILSGIILFGIIGINALVGAIYWKEASVPQLPYEREYLIDLLHRGYFYGDTEKLFELQNSEDNK